MSEIQPGDDKTARDMGVAAQGGCPHGLMSRVQCPDCMGVSANARILGEQLSGKRDIDQLIEELTVLYTEAAANPDSDDAEYSEGETSGLLRALNVARKYGG